MSLICGEHENTVASHYMLSVDELFVVTTAEAPMMTAVCRKALDAIPENERSKESIAGGLDIHWGFSTPNYLPTREGNLSLRNLDLGDYRYSISGETAARYLPAMAKRCLAATP